MSVKKPANSLLRKILIMNNEGTNTIAVFLCTSMPYSFIKHLREKLSELEMLLDGFIVL